MFNRIKSALSRMWQAIKPTVTILGSKTGKALLEIALEGFREAYAGNLKTDHERRAYVFNKLKEHDLTTGNALTDAAVRLILIEAERRYVRPQ